jgi:hypothetical protein
VKLIKENLDSVHVALESTTVRRHLCAATGKARRYLDCIDVLVFVAAFYIAHGRRVACAYASY